MVVDEQKVADIVHKNNCTEVVEIGYSCVKLGGGRRYCLECSVYCEDLVSVVLVKRWEEDVYESPRYASPSVIRQIRSMNIYIYMYVCMYIYNKFMNNYRFMIFANWYLKNGASKFSDRLHKLSQFRQLR